MKRLVMFITLPLLAAFFLSAGAYAADWTFMVFVDGDCNLEDAAIDDFLEMAEVGSDSNVNIVVQMDRINSYDNRYDDWTDCNRFLVTKDMEPYAASAVSDWGDGSGGREVNMGDPATVTDFIDWAMTNYPATNYALVLWNHGDGWRSQITALRKSLELAKSTAERESILRSLAELKSLYFKAVCWDDTSSDTLYMEEVKSAMNGAAGDVNLIGFDACLMGMVEIAYEIKDTGAEVMVASEETEPWDGWPYELIMADLVANPTWNASQLGTSIAERYVESYGGETQSAIDLSRMDSLAARISTFADAMINYWNNDSGAVLTAGQAVMDEVEAAVISDGNAGSWPGVNGLAIYFPETVSEYDSDYDEGDLDFAADTTWDEFLWEFYYYMDDSWITDGREMSYEFFYTEHIDLYDFCDSLVNPPVPCGVEYLYDDTVAYSFEDISATGTALYLEDDGHEYISLPFTFRFYCDDYDSLSIGANGAIYFFDGSHDYYNDCIPATNLATFIAPFWDDLNPGYGGVIYYEIKGDEPERRLIVQWDGLPHYFNYGDGTFQAVLYEESNDIVFLYEDVDFGYSTFNGGASATVGVQENEVSGLGYSCNENVLYDGLAIRFYMDPETIPPEEEEEHCQPHDFDADGLADILWHHASAGMVYLWLMDGYSVASYGLTGTISDTSWQIANLGNFDADYKADILWRHASSGLVYVWLMDGMDIAGHGVVSTLSDPDWEIAGVGDFDGDGLSDVLWRHASSGMVYMWQMDGTDIAGHGVVSTLSDPDWEIAGVGDFDGDGLSDILWRHASSGLVYVWLMDGMDIAGHGVVSTLSDPDWEIAGVGDFDGDGLSDVLWRHASSGLVYMWQMDGMDIAGHGVVSTLSDPDWEIAGVADFDGDGLSDILWRHASSGLVYMWLMDGLTIADFGLVATISDLDWRIIP